MLTSASQDSYIILDCNGTFPGFCRFDNDGMMIWLWVEATPWAPDAGGLRKGRPYASPLACYILC